ncbi:hypothetical protein MRX96_043707 [Rhipicephalus microplus]
MVQAAGVEARDYAASHAFLMIGQGRTLEQAAFCFGYSKVACLQPRALERGCRWDIGDNAWWGDVDLMGRCRTLLRSVAPVTYF